MLSVERLLVFCSALVLMSSAPFEMTVSVLPNDIDEQNHVNNTVYLRWVQEVATAHWRAIAARKRRRASAGSFCGTRSTTKLPPPSVTKSCCARGSAKPLDSHSNGSRKSGGTAMTSSSQRPGPCGVRSIRKAAGRRACQRKCARSFPPELHQG